MDREKVIKGLECCSNSQKNRCEPNSCPYWVSECCCINDMLNDALALLKEQEDLGTELTNAVELIHKKNERIEELLKERETQKFFVDESGKITPLPVVVRCKDCKKRYTVLCIQEEAGNINNQDNWFCADGKR